MTQAVAEKHPYYDAVPCPTPYGEMLRRYLMHLGALREGPGYWLPQPREHMPGSPRLALDTAGREAAAHDMMEPSHDHAQWTQRRWLVEVLEDLS